MVRPVAVPCCYDIDSHRYQFRQDIGKEGDGERGRNRTFNLLIKSQLLCQLSYAPTVGTGGKEQTKIITFNAYSRGKARTLALCLFFVSRLFIRQCGEQLRLKATTSLQN